MDLVFAGPSPLQRQQKLLNCSSALQIGVSDYLFHCHIERVQTYRSGFDTVRHGRHC